MKKVTYYCDICSDETPKLDLFGCRFSNMKDFTLSAADSTDGRHVCKRCLWQLREQSKEIALGSQVRTGG